jgi:hypothetical protein
MNMRNVLFAVGDYVAGGATGAATAVAVRTVIGPDVDLALAMLLGMVVGMVVHLPIGLILSPVLGMFHVMVPGTLIGMYGGMLFAMRDVMQQGQPAQAVEVGVVFGVLVTAGVHLYDRTLTGGAPAPSDSGGA